MALKRRIKKQSKAEVRKIAGRRYLICSECNEEEVEVPGDVGKVICAYCVQNSIAPPVEFNKKEKSDKPRGWHFKVYFEHDGVVYSKGVAVTDPNEINRLKNSNDRSNVPKKKVVKKISRKSTKTKSVRGKKNVSITD